MIKIFRVYRLFFIPYALFLILGAGVLFHFNRIDSHIFFNQFIYKPLNPFFTYITYLGDGIAIAIFLAVTLFIRYRATLYLGLSAAVSGAITNLLKNYAFDDVNRPHYIFKYVYREYELNLVLPPSEMHIHHSFPSGHTTGAFALFTALMLISRKPKWAWVFFTLAMLGGYSRVYLSQHFFMDIYAGSLIGSLTAILFYLLFQNIEKKYDLSWWNKSLLKRK